MNDQQHILDKSELVRYQDLMELLLNAESIKQDLDLVRGQYIEMAGADLIIHLPIMEDPPFGLAMVPVSEGCAYLTYQKTASCEKPEYDFEKTMLVEDVDQYALQKVFYSMVLNLHNGNA